MTPKLGEVDAKWRLKSGVVSYNPKKEIGSGNFAEVFKGELTKTDGKKVVVAVKVSRAASHPNRSTESLEPVRNPMYVEMHNEAMILSLLKHRNVVEFLGISDEAIPVRSMAPESLTRAAVFTAKSDVWAFGMFAHEVFNDGEKAWAGKNVKWIATQIRKAQMPPLPDATPPLVRELVQRGCWLKEPKERLDFQKVNAMIGFLQLNFFPPHPPALYSLQPRVKSATRPLVEVPANYADEAIEAPATAVEFPKQPAITRLSKVGVCKCPGAEKALKRCTKLPPTPSQKSRKRPNEKSEYRHLRSVHETPTVATNTNTTHTTTRE
ncbi:Protein kinase domain-containing protein [Aphelenchoides fujianensis]|nr:Protein kinase domain-containing protein [Aphelenchoides fujianensis]